MWHALSFLSRILPGNISSTVEGALEEPLEDENSEKGKKNKPEDRLKQDTQGRVYFSIF
jgi:hypothetical protein